MRLILASASPRRRELLATAGFRFEVITAGVEEVRRRGEAPQAYVDRLAREKAHAVGVAHPDAWIIAADTIVFLDGEVLEKPHDDDEAKRMLGKIAGRTHTVFTGTALTREAPAHEAVRVTQSNVSMVLLSPAEIAWYVSTGEPSDKAGAYAVQGVGSLFIEAIEGSYTNVVGLPMAALFTLMRSAGLNPLGSGLRG